MAFESGSSLNVVYDNKVIGNTIDPTEWNNNFKEIEDKDNANIAKINANFAKLSANTGSAEVGSPAIAGLGETADSNVYAQLLLATTAILDRYTKTQIDGYRTSDADKYIANITLNAQKDLVITWGDNDQQTIALDLEKIPATFGFDQTGTKLVITNQDGSKYETDVTSLLNLYTFNDSATIDFTANGYAITATINAGSITDTMLHSDLITQLQGYVSSASASALTATNAKTSAESARDTAISAKTASETARDNAQTYANNASASATTATTKASEASTSASEASTSANNADAFATNAKSYAIGTTGTRAGEDTDNAKYYAQIAHDIANIDGIGDAIVASLTKDTLADTDVFGLVDSEDNNTLKKTAWSNVKTKLKTYFDSFYAIATDVFKKDGSVQMTGALKTIGGGTDSVPVLQLQVGDNAVYSSGDANGFILATNAYFDGTVWRRKSDGVAGLFATYGGQEPVHLSAVTGLKDSAITWVGESILTRATGLPLTGGTLTGSVVVTGADQKNFRIVREGQGMAQFYCANSGIAALQTNTDDINWTSLYVSKSSTALNSMITASKNVAGTLTNYKIYGEHNITASTSAPGTLAEGCQHQVYA